MQTPATKFRNTDEYIAGFPENVQALLDDLRSTVKSVAPKATEVISYNMPAFRQNGILCYFAGYKNHIGFYPHGSPIIAFKEELAKYKTSKGAIQFPLDKPIPKTLVKKIVKFRMQEDAEHTKNKKKK